MRRWILVPGGLAALAVWTDAIAQSPPGHWRGELPSPWGALSLGVRIEPSGDGSLTGWLESPDQGPDRLPLSSVGFRDGELTFSASRIRASFTGRWDPASATWTGRWDQPGGSVPLVLRAGELPDRPLVENAHGEWEGAVDTGAASIRVILRAAAGPRGTTALLDAPDQAVRGVPVSALTERDGEICFEIAALAASYCGRLAENGRALAGAWSQSGQVVTLRLVRRTADEGAESSPSRPQTPVGPLPYLEESMIIDNPAAAGVRLAGTLTRPHSEGPHPTVIIISGSGPQDRDGSMFGHKPQLVIADHFTRRGLGVMRFDDRGVGDSTGDISRATSADFAGDVAAVVAALRSRPGVDPDRIGLIGISEGGVVAAMVAADDPAIAQIVLLGSPGLPGGEVVVSQRGMMGRASGETEGEVVSRNQWMTEVIAAVRTADDDAQAAERVRALFASLPDADRPPPAQVDRWVEQLSGPWMQFYLDLDPAETLARVKAPILAVNGSLDLQVAAEPNLDAIRRATRTNPDVTTVVMPGLNHLLQQATTGRVEEYGQIEETVSPVALDTVSTWILARFSPDIPERTTD